MGYAINNRSNIPVNGAQEASTELRGTAKFLAYARERNWLDSSIKAIKKQAKPITPPAALPTRSESTDELLPFDLVKIIANYSAEINDAECVYEQKKKNYAKCRELVEFFIPDYYAYSCYKRKAVQYPYEILEETIDARIKVIKEETRNFRYKIHQLLQDWDELRKKEENADCILPDWLLDIAPSVTALDVSKYALHILPIQAFHNLIKQLQTIEFLDVKGTGIDDRHLRSIAECTTLIKLDISWNQDITDLQPLLQCVNLKKLSWHCCRLSYEQKSAIRQAFPKLIIEG